MYEALILENINDDRHETNIKDKKLKQKLNFLLLNVCVQKIDKNKYVTFKAFASKKKGIIYLLLLSGDEFDGIYEFKVFGQNLEIISIKNELGGAKKVQTRSNYNLAEFNIKNVETIITRSNDIQLRKDMNVFFSNLIFFDKVKITVGQKSFSFKTKDYKELKLRKEIKTIFEKNFADITEIYGVENKKRLLISRMDLGSENFKEQILNLNLVSKKEYDIFTNLNDYSYNLYKNNFKNVEII